MKDRTSSSALHSQPIRSRTPNRTSHTRVPAWGQRVVDAIQVKQGYTIIDVGAGKAPGFQVWSVAVGPTGRVIAEDIDKWSIRPRT